MSRRRNWMSRLGLSEVGMAPRFGVGEHVYWQATNATRKERTGTVVALVPAYTGVTAIIRARGLDPWAYHGVDRSTRERYLVLVKCERKNGSSLPQYEYHTPCTATVDRWAQLRGGGK
jgi:hypothetical protein